MKNNQRCSRIIIIGGGAAGLELAAKLGRNLGKKNKAQITLVDASPTHLWKPLLHEVAAGTLNSYEDELDYLAFASQNYFKFVLGNFQKLNREEKTISLAPIESQGKEIIPARTLSYDVLIIAVGSQANDFNIPGVKDYCLFLDSRQQADHFHQIVFRKLMALSYHAQADNKPLDIAVVGGGATGIELIAELHYAITHLSQYGLDVDPKRINFSLIEASPQLLPNLPTRLSNLILAELKRLQVNIYLDERVIAAEPDGLKTKSGLFIPADLKLWSAGIKAPDFLSTLGLETNAHNQLIVKQTLQTSFDDCIFAIGDCSFCRMSSGGVVPPRAQAAHQQSNFLAKYLPTFLKTYKMPNFKYHDYGSLISLSHHAAGTIMSRIAKNIFLEGKIAKLVYVSLYKEHQMALFGWWRVFILTLANLLTRRIRPLLKLH